MKQQKQTNNLKTILMTSLGLVVFIVLIVVLINSQTKGDDSAMTITEAQDKCTLMEEADMVNYMGEPFGNETTKKAEEHCLSLWDMSKNPENTEESFIKMVETDWGSQKTEVLEGYTLEELYNETHSK